MRILCRKWLVLFLSSAVILVTLMLQGCSDPFYGFDKGTQLVVVARAGNYEEVKNYLDSGVDVNSRFNNSGDTALFGAASFNRARIVKLLLSRGALVDEGHPSGTTPLWIATANGNQVISRLLLENGAGVNNSKGSRYDWSPLHNAAIDGHTEIVKLLIEKGANVNAKISDGNTALSWARVKKHSEIVALLEKAGAK